MEDLTNYPWLTVRGRTFYLRAPVPLDIQESFGRAEIWKSLRTQERKAAIERLRVESAVIVEQFEKHRKRQSRINQPTLSELTEAQLKAAADTYFAHLLGEDEDLRESGFEGEDFDDSADWLEALDEINRAEFARGQISKFMLEEAAEVLSWDNIAIRLANDSPSWPKLARALYAARIKADDAKRLRNAGQVVETPKPDVAPLVIQRKPTLEEAVDFYIVERVSGTEFAQRKRKTRLATMLRKVKEALGGDVPSLPDWTIENAYEVRDFLLSNKAVKPSTVRRDLNDLKGVFSLYKDKKLRSMDNPFAGLDLPAHLAATISDEEVRDPLPETVLTAARALILEKANPDLQLIWRLLEGTGCRVAEIAGLRTQDIIVDGATPHIKIIVHEGRRVKNASSKRDVPLVGDAFSAACDVLKMGGRGGYAFPRYSGPTGPNTASQSLMKWLRKISGNPLHVVHSLRHNMADRCDFAGVSPTDKAAILGHLNKSTSERHYGSDAAKRVRLFSAMKLAFGITDRV